MAQDNAQRPAIKFGDVKAEDFAPKSYDIDPNASAVILSDIGSSKFEVKKQDLCIVFRHHQRMRIMNKNGFDNATVSIELYKRGDYEEKLEDLEAVTYNLENGIVTATKLDNASIYKDKINKYSTVRKFTFPNLKEGSIIEFHYKITGNSFERLRGWKFQSSLPHLWSEYEVSNPHLYDYAIYAQGNRPYDIRDVKSKFGSFTLTFSPNHNSSSSNNLIGTTSQTLDFEWSGDIITNTWALKNVPAIKSESYTNNIQNYAQEIAFQLKSIRYGADNVINFPDNWDDLSVSLLKDEDFGSDLGKDNSLLQGIDLTNVSSAREKAKRIFEYVRDNYTCDHSRDELWLTQTLKKTYNSKSGKVSDINLLLTSLFRSAGFEADPVILSTKDYGRAFQSYPFLFDYNYVVSRIRVGDEFILADASIPYLGFGHLGEDAYNGNAHVIRKTARLNSIAINLIADSLKETSMTSVVLGNDDKKQLSGTYKSNEGYYGSMRLRESLHKSSIEEYFKTIKKTYPSEIQISDPSVDDIKNMEVLPTLNYKLSFVPEGSIMYFNPMLNEGVKENPFKAATREYPVEMPYKIDETYSLIMQIPTGYKAEEMPKSVRVKLNDDDGYFEYTAESDGSTIIIKSRIVLAKATFESDDYETLREFYNAIVKKHAEQIIFKKG